MKELLEALFIGQEVQFRSKYYMGLLTKRKTEWHTGWVRKVSTEGDEIYVHLFFNDPLERRVFCKVPVREILEKHPVFEIGWPNDDGTHRAESTELLELIKLGDTFQEIWNYYIDHEARKYHYEINKHLAQEKECSIIAPSTNSTLRSLSSILLGSLASIKTVLLRLLGKAS